ncbi:hypothetical protein Syun_001424 [Stephania yunnanensis]|uniref:Uncharacterized protein n=1 Tax=Stephania yunnanensis TaxID=152371 RepID=A0AAP0Q7R2_9MAGN
METTCWNMVDCLSLTSLTSHHQSSSLHLVSRFPGLHPHHRQPPSSSPLLLTTIRRWLVVVCCYLLLLVVATLLRYVLNLDCLRLGCEDNTVPLVDEVSILNIIHKQDFNIVSHPIPTVGMSFGNVDELLETYQDHAKEKVFAVVIRSSTKDEDGQLKRMGLEEGDAEAIHERHCKGSREIYHEEMKEGCVAKEFEYRTLRRTDEYKKFKEIEHALHEAILTVSVVEGGRGRTISDQSGKEEELEEIVVKSKVEAKAVKAKVKANQLA